MGKVFTTEHKSRLYNYQGRIDYDGQKGYGIISPVEQAKWAGEANPCLSKKYTLNKPVNKRYRV